MTEQSQSGNPKGVWPGEESEIEIVEGILRGLEDVKAGRVTPHDEVMAQVRARLDAKVINRAT
ncbi:hypothetical protein ABAC460_19400 [Asticcacaulis sp. AC460]|uniref:hypothetical protein n=1 Tax=Asticcacaulis sp. AC460 TaxID=1282360 RepID=UPI0003C3C342|nr:hypothetical protein [Asticcacaulis sp. AC460]ESQ87495.1 hypothetical protein ABAC460_19400 [Asticcacaulis sp. AC460]